MTTPFWSFTPEKIFSECGTSAEGLSQSAAKQKLAEINRKKKIRKRWQRELLLFFNQFKNPLVLLLVAAVILSAFLGETSDVLIILFILLATGVLSFWQESNAGRAVEKLQSIIQLNSTVWRDGKETEIKSDEVVPGDLLLLKSGDIVPADCYLLETNELHANEASLTGESYPVRKTAEVSEAAAPLAKRKNCLWQGSNIVSGTAKAMVVYTGEQTIFGSIAKSASATTETVFEKGIRNFGYFLMQITVTLSIVILVLNLLFHRPLIDSVLFALALAVGMAPELLPAIMTIAMSAGAKRMSEKKVIVKKLSSIQNFGEVNLLCTDKTGTITEGIIQIAGARGTDGNENEYVKKLAFLNATFETGFPNPIDEAIKQMKLSAAGYEKLGEIPYDFMRKRLSVAVSDGKESLLITKGAVKNVLDVCTQVLQNGEPVELSTQTEILHRQFIDYSNEGYRVIGLCYKPIQKKIIAKEDERDMIFAGFILMEDPLKQGIAEAIAELNRLNVKVKIITGDNRYVAAHIGKKLNMNPDKIMTGAEAEDLTPPSLAVRAADTDIFAEVEPQQKEMLIRALQKAARLWRIWAMASTMFPPSMRLMRAFPSTTLWMWRAKQLTLCCSKKI